MDNSSHENGLQDFDSADYLKTDATRLEYLQMILEDCDENGKLVAYALGTAVRSQDGMARVAEKTGLSRESLYKSLSGRRDPPLTTILKIFKALGVRLRLESASAPPMMIESTSIKSAVNHIVLSNPYPRGQLNWIKSSTSDSQYESAPEDPPRRESDRAHQDFRQLRRNIATAPNASVTSSLLTAADVGEQLVSVGSSNASSMRVQTYGPNCFQ